MRCPRCGNENPATNRFCGMCGAILLPAPAPQPAPIEPAPARSNVPVSTPVAVPEPVRAEEPVLGAPSFLGLNQPPPRTASPAGEPRRGDVRLSIDPNSVPPPRNLDYLLEDDEPPSRGGGWKAVAILIALALAVGLGYLRWKNQGFAWLNLQSHTVAPADNSPDSESTSPPSSPPSSPADNASGKPDAASGTTNPTSGTPASTVPGSTPPPSPNSTIAPAPATAAPADGGGAPNSSVPLVPAQPQAAPVQTANQPAVNPQTPPAQAQSTSDEASSPSATQPPAAKLAPPGPDTSAASADDSGNTAQPRPSAQETPKPAKPADPVAEAQKYLYGKGVTQNCDRGLRILKPLADRANPKAMTEMGALYSAGLCTPRDLPTAYRWFALALRKDPENDALQADLNELWGEMTQPERQLAIKMSQ